MHNFCNRGAGGEASKTLIALGLSVSKSVPGRGL
jgi:hypothetical protein